MSPDEFLVAMGASICGANCEAGWMDESILKLGLMIR